MKNLISELPELAKKSETRFLQFLKKNKKKLEKLDSEIHFLHKEAVEKFNCLECANCCRSLGPLITFKDIEKISKSLRIKQADFVEQYLKVDEDGDYIFNSMPCPFLMSDNYCSIYEYRPKACREYPHTNRKNFTQIYTLTVRNAQTCPIAFDVLFELTK